MRVAEATIAILLILGALLILSQKDGFRAQSDLAEILPSVLNEVAQSSELRRKVIRNEPMVLEELKNFIDERIVGSALEFEVRVCDLEVDCLFEGESVGDIYSAERVISASIEEPNFEPKKVKIFLWRVE
jgi:hypothetical protein